MVLGRYDFGFPSKTRQYYHLQDNSPSKKEKGRRGGVSTPIWGSATRCSRFYSDITKRLPIINPRKKNAAAMIIE